MTLIDDYLELQEKYEKKYGEKTIVLMEVGDFFEIYGVVNDEKTRGKIYEVADITNLNVSKKKSDLPISEKNPLMAGFPNYSFDKWKEILLRNEYTIIKVEQDAHKTKDPKRIISEIISPGVNIETNNFINSVISIYIEEMKCHKTNKPILCVGISIVDITTGETSVYETNSKSDDFKYGLDEIYRFLQMINPQEIIINTENLNMEKDELLTYLECSDKNVRYNIYSKNKYMLENKFKLEILKKVYTNTGLLTPIEYIDMVKIPFALNSYIYLIQFIYEHNEKIIEKLNKPKLVDNKEYLILSHDSIIQLNIIPDKNRHQSKGINSLWDILDKTTTTMGKRLLRDNLINPIINIDELEKRYNLVECLQTEYECSQSNSSNKTFVYKNIRDILKGCYDIERLHRKMAIKMLNPNSFLNLDISYKLILKVITYIQNLENKISEKSFSNIKNILPKKEIIDEFKNFINEYNDTLILEKLKGINLNSIKYSFFKKGIYEDIDKCMNNILYYEKVLNEIGRTLSNLIDKNKTVIELKENDKEGHYLSLTNIRANLLKKALTGQQKLIIKIKEENEEKEVDMIIKNLEYKLLSGTTKIISNEIKNYSHSLINYQTKMNTLALSKFQELIQNYYSKYNNVLKEITHFVSYIDFISCISYVSTENGYIKPEIVKDDNDASYINAKDLRHPIIEKINNQIQYISNDIELGINKNQQGILLFGLNCVGKSTLMKSVGIAIVMAQSGFFVPASKFVYNPYKYLFTRINNNDNIFKGQSTFAVEMSELRGILKRANKNSLVLGDELCSGTETTSALAIVSAGVKRLVDKETSFIFTTHLHPLVDIDEIKNEQKVKSYHMETLYDENTKKLIYNRKLQLGSGSTIYGLEVAKAMDLDDEFIKSANTIRKRILGQTKEIVVNKTSQFNKNLIISNCSICKQETNEVHHINEQNLANNIGMIGQFHKNNLWNLVQLCKNCHYNVHHHKLDIIGYIQTSEGIELQYNMNENKVVNKRKKFSNLEQQIVKDVFSTNSSYTNTKKTLLINNNINISIETIKKIINNEYK